MREPPGPGARQPVRRSSRRRSRRRPGSTPSSSATSWETTVSGELPQNGENIVTLTPPVGPMPMRTLSGVVDMPTYGPGLWNQNSVEA